MERKIAMNKNNYTTVTLKKGKMHIYDFGSIKLHAYNTNDAMQDEVFIFEKNKQSVILESPCFKDNILELTDYLKDIDKKGILIAYHGAGGSFLPGIPKYATKNAEDYTKNGGGKALIENFSKVFGENFDSSVHQITNFLKEGSITIAGITFIIRQTAEAFDVEIPEIHAVYTHMLGHDCHSIVAGADHADAMIAQLKNYIASDYQLILTSHYTPEDLKDVQTKISYLQDVKELAQSCTDAESFKKEISKRFPSYSGENYLNMTAGFFFD